MRGKGIPVPCSIFPDRMCASENNRKGCKGVFYACADLNALSRQDEALAKFRLFEQNPRYPDEVPNETFDFNRTCDPRMDKKGVPMKKTEQQENNDEAFICKCMYLCYRGECPYLDQCVRFFRTPSCAYQIVGYQIPPVKGKRQNVDLVIQGSKETGDSTTIYLTEAKPPQKNTETLLRMIAEILHHYRALEKNELFFAACQRKYKIEKSALKVRPALLFFNDTPQRKEYCAHKSEIEEILNEYGIAVFECDGKSKEIKKIR